MVAVTINGRTERVRGGDTVAAALLSVGIVASRAADVSGAPRAPYCMMGVCFECLITIDGVGNRQGCLVPVAAGMRIETQRGKHEVGR
jgi:sarcosine oxidase subunit alpha